MQTKIINISGMHCSSCELLIEDELTKISWINQVKVNHREGSAQIGYEGEFQMNEVEAAIRRLGYDIGQDKHWFLSHRSTDYRDLGVAFIVLVVLYYALKWSGFLNLDFNLQNSFSLAVVLLVGVTAGLSTCMALVGGLILGLAARFAEKHPEASVMRKFRPHLYFNLGRIIGYAFLGGLLGAAGSVFKFSTGTIGVITVIVGLVMLIVGLQLTEIFPRLTRWKLTLPSGLARFFGITNQAREYSHSRSMTLGALTFFLPCGFTQAMQLYAVNGGSFWQGFLIMGIFALGTAPGLLGVGGLASAVKGIWAKRFFKFAGLLVIFLALFNLSNGLNLTSLSASTVSKTSQTKPVTSYDPNVTIENGVQVIYMIEGTRGYSPNKFTVRKGVPVKWIIDARAPYSCASSLISPNLGVDVNLQPGENVINFVPKASGRVAFSCSMGMYNGVFNVEE